MVEETYRGARKWSRNAQAVAAVVWISFLSASLATMLFFAFLDPVDVLGTIDPDIEIGREAGYAIGFFFFWFICAVCSAVTAWLVRTAPKQKQ